MMSLFAITRKADRAGVLALLRDPTTYATIDINATKMDGENILHIAARLGWLDVADVAVRLGCNINAQRTDGWTPLHCAVYEQHISMVEFLLLHNANRDSQNECGHMPSHYSNSKEIDALLVSATNNMQHWSILQAAHKGGQGACVTLLSLASSQNLGVDINETKHDGENILHIAAHFGWHDVVEKALSMGANINGQRYDGWTPLHCAVFMKHLAIVKLLINNGAVRDVENALKRKPLQYASDQHMKDLLTKYSPPQPSPSKQSPLSPATTTSSNEHDLWSVDNIFTSTPHALNVLIKGNDGKPLAGSIALLNSDFCSAATTLVSSLKPQQQTYGVSLSGTQVEEFFEKMMQHKKLMDIVKEFSPDLMPSKMNSIFAVGCGSKENNCGCASHTDDSDLTLNFCVYSTVMGKPGCSDIILCSPIDKKQHVYHHNAGHLLIHRGNIEHSVSQATEGERLNIIVWLKHSHPKPTQMMVLSMPKNITDLHYEVLVQVCSFLDAWSLCQLGITCQTLYQASNDKVLWKMLCQGKRITAKPVQPTTSWKQHYSQLVSKPFVSVPMTPLFDNPTLIAKTPMTSMGGKRLMFAVVGAQRVGKSNLVLSLTQNRFIDDQNLPLSDMFYRKRVCVDNLAMLWEVYDSYRWDPIHNPELFLLQQVLDTAEGCLVLFDITNLDSFIMLGSLVECILSTKGKEWVPMVLVGTKSDLSDKRVVSVEEAQSVAQQWGTVYVETSAKRRVNVEEPFKVLARLYSYAKDTVTTTDHVSKQKKNCNVM